MNKLFKSLNPLLAIGVLTLGSAFGELPMFNNVTVAMVGNAGQNMESLMLTSAIIAIAPELLIATFRQKYLTRSLTYIVEWIVHYWFR